MPENRVIYPRPHIIALKILLAVLFLLSPFILTLIVVVVGR